MGNALKIEVAGNAATRVRGFSRHNGVRRFAMYLLAELANDADRYGTVYVQQLADALGVRIREAQYVLRHLESSGEVRFWNRPNASLMFFIRELEYHQWPDSYIAGDLVDGRSRPRWTATDDDNRRATSSRQKVRA